VSHTRSHFRLAAAPKDRQTDRPTDRQTASLLQFHVMTCTQAVNVHLKCFSGNELQIWRQSDTFVELCVK